MSERTLGATFTWDAGSREWRLATRRDGSPLVRAWPGLHLRLEQGRPVLVVPRGSEEPAR